MQAHLQLDKSVEKLLRKIGEIADSIGLDAYVIGGYVRDLVLGRPCKDIDIVTTESGVELAEKVHKEIGNNSHIHIFKTYGTAMIRSGDYEIEFVGARKESYQRESRNPTVTPGTLEDDQNRRDFSINAMAIQLNKSNFGEFIDPFNGLNDIQRKRIVTPLDPDITFSDDPLRMLRAIRFAGQLNFDLDPETKMAIKRNAYRIKIITQERVTTELRKMINSATPSIPFLLLDETGILPYIFKELPALKGVETINGKSHKDNFYHTLEVLDNVAQESDNEWLRWAALLHDIAKPPTKRFDPELGWTFHGHEVLGAKWVPRLFKNLKLPLDHKMKYVQNLVRLHLRPISLTKNNITDSAIRRLLFDAGDDIDDLMLLCKADVTSKNHEKVKRYRENYTLVSEKLKTVEENDKIRNWQPPISGELIMETFGIPPSKKVGEIKTAIREAILEGDIKNDYQEAYELMLKLGIEYGLLH